MHINDRHPAMQKDALIIPAMNETSPMSIT